MTTTENKPNWVDKANLASNVLQNIQLQEVHSTLRNVGALEAEKLRLEFNEQQTKECEDRLREHIWQMENAFIPLANNPEITPCTKYVFVRQIQNGLSQFNVTTASFRQFADKDRLNQFCKRMETVIEQSTAKMTTAQKTEVETYLGCEAEIAELDILLQWYDKVAEQEKMRQEMLAKQERIKELRVNLSKLPMGGPQEFVMICCLAVGGCCLLAGLSWWPFIVCAILGLFIALIIAGFDSRKLFEIAGRYTTESQKLKEQIDSLEYGINEAAHTDLELQVASGSTEQELLQKYRAENRDDLLRLKQEREIIVRQFRLANGLLRNGSSKEQSRTEIIQL